MVRDARIEDIDRIAQIAVDAWHFAYADFLPTEFMAARADPARRATRIRERWPTEFTRLVAMNDQNEVIGFAFDEYPCTLAGFDAEIGALYVDPKFNRCGAGRALVQAMVRQYLTRGATSMAIHTLTENKVGCAFYKSVGGEDGPHTTWNDIPSRWFIWPNLKGP